MYKKAQISETMTWFIASIIIIILMLASVLVVSSGSFKGIKSLSVKGEENLFVTKTLTAYLLTKDNRTNIYEKTRELGEEGRLSDEIIVNPDLAKKIFNNIYEGFDNVWLGFVFVQGITPNGIAVQDDFPNLYFLSKQGKSGLAGNSEYSYEEIWLDKEGKIAVEIIKYHKD